MSDGPRLPAAAVEDPQLRRASRRPRRQEAQVASVGTEAWLADALAARQLHRLPAGPVRGPQGAAALIGLLVIARDEVGDGRAVGSHADVGHVLKAVPVVRTQWTRRAGAEGREAGEEGEANRLQTLRLHG